MVSEFGLNTKYEWLNAKYEIGKRKGHRDRERERETGKLNTAAKKNVLLVTLFLSIAIASVILKPIIINTSELIDKNNCSL